MVIDKLTEDADGMFRWVYCKLEVLRQCHRNDLHRILKELPQSLDKTYQRILKEINNAYPKEAHRLFQCLVAAHRPLRVEELAEVLTLDVDAGGLPTFNTNRRREDHEAAVLSTCSSLVSVVDHDGSRVVQFCHFSVKEFLMSDRLSSMEDVSQFHIAHEPSHVILAQACLGVLLSLDDSTSKDSAKDIPLSGYASEYWFRHAQVGDVNLQIKDALDRFFDPDKPHFAAFFRRSGPLFKLRFFRTSSHEEPIGAPTPAVPFYFATILGFSALAERLIPARKPQVINFCGYKGTLLHLAVREGYIEAVRLLLAHGADINSRKDYASPPHIASLRRYSLRMESRIERPLDSDLDAMIGTGPQDSDVGVRSEESYDAEMAPGEERGFTPLHLAVSEGHLDICQMLLERNADVRVHDDRGDTPLHLAASTDRLEIARILVTYNAEVNPRNEDGSTPLLVASSRGNIDISSLLLAHNANAFVRDNRRSTPLHLAAIGGHLEVARMLLELKVEVDSRNVDGFTPLLMASSKGNLGMLRLLLAHNADVLVHDNSGNTPLHLATIGGHLEVARMLLELKVEVDSQNYDGLTPLQRVSRGRRKGYRDIMRLLLNHGANMNVHDKHRNTSLHFAASEGVLKVTPDTTSNFKFYQSRRALRQWISPPDQSSNFYTASDAHHKGTTAWCTEGDTFADWMASGSLLWIHGKPGSGKTILSSVIIRDIESLSDFGSVFLAYFYFNFKDYWKRDSRALLSSLLDQLSNQSGQFCDVLHRLYSEHYEGSIRPQDDALVRCLKDMLTITRSVPIYLVMDALDECPDDKGGLSSRSQVLSVVEELVNLRLPNLHLCITSRPEFGIRTFLKPLATQEISLDNESGQMQKD
ncbi:Ankyrin repeat-containing domain protein [Lactarius tabidus]